VFPLRRKWSKNESIEGLGLCLGWFGRGTEGSLTWRIFPTSFNHEINNDGESEGRGTKGGCCKKMETSEGIKDTPTHDSRPIPATAMNDRDGTKGLTAHKTDQSEGNSRKSSED